MPTLLHPHKTLMIPEWRHCPPHLTDEDREALIGLGSAQGHTVAQQ